MSKKIILPSLLAIAAVIALYSLPRTVVENEGSQAEDTEHIEEGDASSHQHDPAEFFQPLAADLSSEDQQAVEKWRQSLSNEGDKEKSAKFADYLRDLYGENHWLDSAIHYGNQALELSPTIEREKAWTTLEFEKFSNGKSAQKDKLLASLQSLADKNADDLSIKTKLASLKTLSQAPMEGILMLREVLEEDPENEEALFQMGQFSRQSGQMERAIERYKSLYELDPNNIEAGFYLALSYLDQGNMEDSKIVFEELQNKNVDDRIAHLLSDYMNRF